MPIHDWTRVDAGIFHDFHLSWTAEIKGALNRGLLPPEYYALAEQIVGGLGPDVVTLERPGPRSPGGAAESGGMVLTATPPRAEYHLRGEIDPYAAKANRVAIRHRSGHELVAVIEIVSPGNKNSRHGINSLVSKAIELIQGGIHLLVMDLFPPGPRDPEGIHPLIWSEFSDEPFTLPTERRLTLAAYLAGMAPEAFIQPVAIGSPLPEMPLFLTPETYIPVPLDPIYQTAWADVPNVWKDVLTAS